MNPESWLVFSSIALLATLIPGPAILLAVSHSVAYGFKNALATILGNISGLFLMSALSVLGLSTIILYSTTVFIAIKYLVYCNTQKAPIDESRQVSCQARPRRGSHSTSRGRNTADGLSRFALREVSKTAIAVLQPLAREQPLPADCALHSRFY